MEIRPEDAEKMAGWKCVGTDSDDAFDGNATLMFPNVPKNAVAALITVRASSLEYGTVAASWGTDQEYSISSGETRLIEGSYDFLKSLYCAGESGLTTSFTTYFGDK